MDELRRPREAGTPEQEAEHAARTLLLTQAQERIAELIGSVTEDSDQNPADIFDLYRAVRDEEVRVVIRGVNKLRGASEPDVFECDGRLLEYFGALYRAAQNAKARMDTGPHYDTLNEALALPPDIEAAVEGPRGR